MECVKGFIFLKYTRDCSETLISYQAVGENNKIRNGVSTRSSGKRYDFYFCH